MYLRHTDQTDAGVKVRIVAVALFLALFQAVGKGQKRGNGPLADEPFR